MDLTPTQAVDECISRLQGYRASITAQGTVTKVKNGDDLQLAHDSAKPGDTLLVDPGDYKGVVINKSIAIVPNATLPFERVSKDQDGMIVLSSRDGFTEPLLVPGNAVVLVGIECNPVVPDRTIVTLSGDRIMLDRVLIRGNLNSGQRRGIAANCSNLKMTKCHVSDIFHHEDAQAIMIWNGAGPFDIDDCYLSASGETILTGGADSTKQPSHLSLTNSYLTKNVSWHGPSAVVKNTLELKDMISAKISNNIIENSWSDGQVGYLVVLTPRNQDGSELDAAVQHIEISDNEIRNGGAGVQLLGQDNRNQSLRMVDINILNNKFNFVGMYPGDHRLFLFTGAIGAKDVTITGNVQTNSFDMNSFLYLDGPVENLVFTGNDVFEGEYGLMAAGGTPGIKSWNQMAIGGKFAQNTIRYGGIRNIDYGGNGNVVIK